MLTILPLLLAAAPLAAGFTLPVSSFQKTPARRRQHTYARLAAPSELT